MSFSICVGSVEVEADGPALALETVPLPVLWIIASLKISLAFLQFSKDGGVPDPRCEVPTMAERKLQGQNRI